MPGKQRSNSQLARDRRKIADLYLKGWLQADIAEELGISDSTVSRDLAAMRKAWLKSALMDFNEAKARELAEIDHLERVAWAEWLESKEAKESTVQKTSTSNRNKRVEAQIRKETRLGDPRYLGIIQWCIDRRCKILGVDAPTQTQVSGALEIDVTDARRALARRLAGIAARERESGDAGDAE